MSKPETITIGRDRHHAKFVGTAQDGSQFFLTTPFEPAIDDYDGCKYIALFIFDSDGTLVNHDIDALGSRKSLDKKLEKAKLKEKIKSLGKINYGDIVVKPFSIMHNGVEFGLIASEMDPEDSDDGGWTVELLPGNYMAFFEPWDSGEYDT